MDNSANKFIDFIITQKCSYSCEYCSQSKKQAKNKTQASKKTISSFLRFLKTLSRDYEITITGGEAILHVDFFNLILNIKKMGFKINLISNFSFPIEIYEKIFALIDDDLNRFDLSFHLDQIKNFDETIEKLLLFLEEKPSSTITTFLIPEYKIDKSKQQKIDKIIEIAKKYTIEYEFQKIRILNHYQDNTLKSNKTFALDCWAGCKSAVIYDNGDVYRCYSSRFFRSNYLGNINKKNFKLKSTKEPCIMSSCTCPKPQKYNQITNKKKYPKACFESNL